MIMRTIKINIIILGLLIFNGIQINADALLVSDTIAIPKDTLPVNKLPIIDNIMSPMEITIETLNTNFNKINFYPPEAASLMRYVDYPVSPLTGIPDINIPIYTINTGSVSIPIELNFHIDNYMRVNQLPGSVGAGWSLSTEYQITRTINGLDDFLNGNLVGYINSFLVIPNYTGQYVNRSLSEQRRVAQGKIDTEPDKFYYKIPGKSGSFYFQKQSDGSFIPVTVPYDGVKITHSPQGGKFLLTDTDGTSYLFSSYAVDKSLNLSDSYTTEMAWKCDKIINAQGIIEATFSYSTQYSYLNLEDFNGRREIYDDIVDYEGEYSPYSLKCNEIGANPVHDYDYEFWKVTGPKMKHYGGYGSEALFYSSNGEFENITDQSYTIGGKPARSIRDLSLKYMSEISFSGGKVVFLYADNHILTSIQIKKTNNDIIKTITFTQPTTEIGSSYPSHKYNRTLNQLTIGDQVYSFTYGKPHDGGVIPYFWGYSGTRTSSTWVPLPSQQVNISMGECVRYFNDCQPVVNKYSSISIGGENIFTIDPEGSLLRINYPTGGSVEFIVEQNRFRDPVDQLIKGAGGYRIGKIKYYTDGQSNCVKEKIYKYGPMEDGTGLVMRQPVVDREYDANTYTLQYTDYYYGETPIYRARKRTYLPSTIASLNFDNGSAVNYNEVAEYEMNLNTQAGKTVYKSDLYFYTPLYASPSDPYPLEDDEWYLGKPDSVIYYKYEAGNYIWTQKKKYLYNKYFDPVQIFRGRCLIYTEPVIVGGTVSSYDTFFENNAEFNYKTGGIKTGIVQLLGEDIYNRDPDGRVHKMEKRNYYDSPKDFLPSRLETKMGDGSLISEHTIYPKDYLTSNGEGAFINSLVAKNMLAVAVEKIQRRNGKVISGSLNIYNTNGTLSSVYSLKGSVFDESSFKLSNRVQGNYTSSASSNSAFSKFTSYLQDMVVNKYDAYYNPVSVTYTDRNFPVCYIWSYNGQYIIAEIKNATYSAVQAALGSAPETYSSQVNPDMSSINQLRNVLTSAQVTTYTYNPLVGMISSTDPKGFTSYYGYDTNGRLNEVYFLNNGVKNILRTYNYHYKNQ